MSYAVFVPSHSVDSGLFGFSVYGWRLVGVDQNLIYGHYWIIGNISRCVLPAVIPTIRSLNILFTVLIEQIPAIACASLCYAFWLSFARIGGDSVSATIWPLVWLLFMLVLMVNPIPVLSRSTRFWFLRNVGRLLTSGLHRVEVCARYPTHIRGEL